MKPVKRRKKRKDSPRVVIVTDLFPATSQPYVIERFTRLRDMGWDIRIVTADFDADAWSRLPILANRPKLRKRISTAKNDDLAKAVAALAPDLVHVEFAYRAEELLSLQDSLGCKIIASFQNYDARLVLSPRHYRPIWERVDAVHTVSHHLWRTLPRAGCPPFMPHAIIYPSVDAGFFDPGPRQHDAVISAERPLRILSVGRLHWAKGYDYGLQAVRLLLDQGIPCEYRIIARGDFRWAVQYTIDDLGLRDTVRILGARPPEEVRAELAWADVLLHPSVSEAFGIATIEAQAMMVPVVCSDALGLPEAVADDETGLIVPRRDPAALASALARMARDPAERQRLGEAGRRRVQEQFTPESYARQFDAFYRRVLAAQPG